MQCKAISQMTVILNQLKLVCFQYMSETVYGIITGWKDEYRLALPNLTLQGH